jgi:pimeloyl-ACP methyl ester carboxylesterase
MAQAQVNGISIEIDVQGPEGGEPVLLIMGLNSQLTRWGPVFLEKLIARGVRAIRFDNRDVGLSQKFTGLPNIQEIAAAKMRGEKPDVPYTLDDMAADAVGVLDHLGVQRAHVVGASMGGMIGQLVAADYPQRVLSLTSIMSTTGNPALPQATPEAQAILFTPAPNWKTDEAAFLDYAVKTARTLGGPTYLIDEAFLRERALNAVKRCFEPAGAMRQIAAVTVTGDRRAKLAKITAPTLVMHGDADPLVRVEGGRDTAACIPGAELEIIPGMGHDLPPALYDRVIDGICRSIARAKQLA